MHKKLYFFYLILLLFPMASMGQQIENSGFEEWEFVVDTLIMEPVEWNTIKTCDNQNIANVAPITFEQSTDAHSGSYSLKLFNFYTFGISATGAICNGRFHAEYNLDKSYSYTDPSNPKWNLPITSRPDSLTGWFKYFPQGNDAAQFKAILHVDSCKLPENGTLANWVGMAVYKTPSGVTFDTWTRFSVPFNYYDNRTPEHMLCTMNSGDSTTSIPDSYLLIDDLELIYKNAGILDLPMTEEFLIISGKSIVIDLKSDEEYINRRFSLINLTGQTVYACRPESSQVVIPSNLKAGVYVAILDGKQYQHVQKVMIH